MEGRKTDCTQRKGVCDKKSHLGHQTFFRWEGGGVNVWARDYPVVPSYSSEGDYQHLKILLSMCLHVTDVTFSDNDSRAKAISSNALS